MFKFGSKSQTENEFFSYKVNRENSENVNEEYVSLLKSKIKKLTTEEKVGIMYRTSKWDIKTKYGDLTSGGSSFYLDPLKEYIIKAEIFLEMISEEIERLDNIDNYDSISINLDIINNSEAKLSVEAQKKNEKNRLVNVPIPSIFYKDCDSLGLLYALMCIALHFKVNMNGEI